MMDDCTLFLIYFYSMDLHLRAFWRSVKMLEDRFMKGTVFITGATGFLGSHILCELIRVSKVSTLIID
jgi:hypothetical protein